MYRKFKLLNSNNQEWYLTEQDFKVFANNPQGLGFSKTISTIRLGDEELLLYSLANLDNITFEMLFYDDTLSDKYQKYVDFVAFASFKPIYLFYQRPNAFEWYRRKVEIVSVAKGEVDYRDSMLHCQTIIKPLGFWEDDIESQIDLGNRELEGGKIYPINYPINYGNDTYSNIPFISQGLIETPMQIFINVVIVVI